MRATQILVACVVAAAPLGAQTKQPAVKPAALAKLAEPWPDADGMRERRVEAENRRLFAAPDAFPFTLAADFKAINKDRSVEGKKDFPGVITVAGEGGSPATVAVKLRTRGHFRLRATSCSFVPLRVEFDREQVRGTIFDGQKTLKLVTHCQSDREYEQYTRREYLTYRAFNILTPQSFRARLATVSYVQSTDKKPVITRLGLFLEDDDDVARRMEGRIIETQKLVFRQTDYDTATLMTIFEYMIGNTDMSMYLLHNVVLVQTPKKVTYPVPYDFDYSGLVDARYAVPAKQFNITSVRDRVYRGPCRTQAEFQTFFEKFTELKPKIMEIFDTVPGMDAGYRKDAQKYLEGFYSTISKPGDVKKAFIDECNNRAGM